MTKEEKQKRALAATRANAAKLENNLGRKSDTAGIGTAENTTLSSTNYDNYDEAYKNNTEIQQQAQREAAIADLEDLDSRKGNDTYEEPSKHKYDYKAKSPDKAKQKDAKDIDEEYVKQMERGSNESYGDYLKRTDKENGTHNYRSKLAADIFKSIGNTIAAGLHGAAGKEYQNKEGTGIFDLVEKYGSGMSSKDYDKMKEGRQDIAEKEKEQNYNVNQENRDFNAMIDTAEFNQDQAKELSDFMANQNIKTAEDLQNLSNRQQQDLAKRILGKNDVSPSDVAQVVKYLSGQDRFDQIMGKVSNTLSAAGQGISLMSDKKTKIFCSNRKVFS